MARKSTAPSSTSSTPADAAGHRHDPLDPDVAPRKTKEGAPSPVIQKYGMTFLTIAAVLLFLFVIAWIVKRNSTTAQTSSSRAQNQTRATDAPDLPRAWNPDGSMTDPSTWKQVQVPARGESVRVPHALGYHVVWSQGIKVHCIYADGRPEGIVGDPDRPCGSGPIVASYAKNETDTLVIASYAYAKTGEK